MRPVVFFGLIVILSTVYCKEQRPQHRDNIHPRRYKDSKNKRGIGDYPPSLNYGGPLLQNFQSPSAAIPFQHGFPSFGSFSGYGTGSTISLPHSSFSFPAQPSSGFSNLGVHSLASSNLGNYASNYNLVPSTLSPSFLGSQSSGHGPYSSPNFGLYSVQEKTGPVTFGAHASNPGQIQQQYTPIYATANHLGTNSYSVPVILGASPVSNLQISSFSSPSVSGPSSRSLSALSSLTPSSSSPSGDTSAHAVSGGYVIAAATPQQSVSPSTYTIPTTSLSSSPSAYAIAIPAGYGAAANSAFRSSSSASNYQSPVTLSSYSTSPSSASISGYLKLSPTSSNSGTYFAPMSLSNVYGGSLSSNSGQSNPASSTSYIGSLNYPTTSLAPNHAAAPSYTSNNFGPSFASISTFSNSKSSPSSATPPNRSSGSMLGSHASSTNYLSGNSANSQFGSASPLVTSYGTPAISYPSTSYGTPSNSVVVSSSNYKSQNSEKTNLSNSHNSQSASSYTAPHDYVSANPSSSYNADSHYKSSDSNYGSSAVSYSGPSSSYDSASSISNEENYSSPTSDSSPNVSNSLEGYSSSGTFSSFDGPDDSSGSYSNFSPRYHRYPLSRTSLSHVDEPSDKARYDTIAYSVGSGKY